MAGNVLVAMRRDYGGGVSEMEILDYMIRSHTPGVSMSFDEAAALSTVFLAAETGRLK